MPIARPGPSVSIPVPWHNGARHLSESLDSIPVQSYPDSEVLLLDDASTEDTNVRNAMALCCNPKPAGSKL